MHSTTETHNRAFSQVAAAPALKGCAQSYPVITFGRTRIRKEHESRYTKIRPAVAKSKGHSSSSIRRSRCTHQAELKCPYTACPQLDDPWGIFASLLQLHFNSVPPTLALQIRSRREKREDKG